MLKREEDFDKEPYSFSTWGKIRAVCHQWLSVELEIIYDLLEKVIMVSFH